jgi:hypothetical protein
LGNLDLDIEVFVIASEFADEKIVKSFAAVFPLEAN